MASYSKLQTDFANKQVGAQDYGIAVGAEGVIGTRSFNGRGADNNITAGGDVYRGDMTFLQSGLSENELKLFESINDSTRDLFTGFFDAQADKEAPSLQIFNSLKKPAILVISLFAVVKILGLFFGGTKK